MLDAAVGRYMSGQLSPRRLVTPQGMRAVQLQRPAEAVRARNWEEWVKELFPSMVEYPFADFHCRLWDYVEGIQDGYADLQPYVAIWPRGFAKSTTMSLAAAKCLAEGRRRYFAILCSSYEKSEERLAGVRSSLESPYFRRRYPLASIPAATGRGASRSWTNRLLISQAGFVVQAFSLEGDMRGSMQIVNGESLRIDFAWMDDIDKERDSNYATINKERFIRSQLMPARDRNRGMVWVFTQNLIGYEKVCDRLRTATASFGRQRILDGPIPAIKGLEYQAEEEEREDLDGTKITVTRHVITAGESTWKGYSLEDAQQAIDSDGIMSFMAEMQHRPDEAEGAMLTRSAFIHLPADHDISGVRQRVVGVDPSGGTVEHGIVVIGMSVARVGNAWRPVFYVIEDLTVPGSVEWEPVVAAAACRHRCDIITETNGVGARSPAAIRSAWDHLYNSGRVNVSPEAHEIHGVHAKDSKDDRALPMKRAYLEGRVFHVGKFPRIEREWTSWVPGMPGARSPNALDAAVHAHNHLAEQVSGHVEAVSVAGFG